jgi:flagellar motility protein MotE (MotC chaperone)
VASTRRIIDGLLITAAVLLLVLVAGALVLWFAVLPGPRRDALIGVAQGRYEAVESGQVAALQEQVEALRAAQPDAMTVAEREAFARFSREERRELAALRQRLRSERNALERREREIAQQQAELERERQALETRRDAVVLRKVRQLYMNMDADVVAEDLAALMEERDRLREQGRTDEAQARLEHVVSTLDGLPERFAAEVLGDLPTTQMRNTIIQALRERRARGLDE